MGIHGIFKEIGPGQRISLAKFSSDHFVATGRPLRLAIDISIWLFQIQAGKGGFNPALRTFYYRLLRLLSHNIHPLFVFDGPNKPLFKRNKKVGGPGVRVASVPEFLAKQLLKQFGFPWHVAPGEAEAECALLQQESIVDAVLSEDVDTLMFGSGVTLKNWSAENTSKVPTHVNVYRAGETKEKSGMDREGMILVALMSGGDYITEGIPGCGPKLACDAARAGYGKELCAIRKKDTAGFVVWREKLQHQIRTNAQKIFSRKNSKLVIPDDFPNLEVLGYYTQPCVSTVDKLARLRQELIWDQDIDFAALRNFAGDAFDWRCLGGAKKFIRNLAPAMLVRDMRISSGTRLALSQPEREEREKDFIEAIHGKRNHSTTDGEVEYRVSFIPMRRVAIDLNVELEDNEFVPAGGVGDESDAESEFATVPSGTADQSAPSSPIKKRMAKPYEPDLPEKLWVMSTFLQAGCPILVEEYEASLRDPKAFFKQRRKARTVGTSECNLRTKQQSKKKPVDRSQVGAILRYGTITKSSQASLSDITSSQEERNPLQDISGGPNAGDGWGQRTSAGQDDKIATECCGFRLPATQIPSSLQKKLDLPMDDEDTPKAKRQVMSPPATTGVFARFAAKKGKQVDAEKTRRGRKRLSDEAVSPALSQKTIESYWSPSPRKTPPHFGDVINLLSSSPPARSPLRALTPTPNLRHQLIRDAGSNIEDGACINLPDSVTKRRKKASLRRCKTAPPVGVDEAATALPLPLRSSTPDVSNSKAIEAVDLASPPSIPLFQRSGSLFKTRASSSTGRDQTAPQPVISPSLAVGTGTSLRRSPRQEQARKKRIELRGSLQGAWKVTEVEELDLSGDGSGWKKSQGRAKLPTWRKSGVEVLDLTGV